MLTVEQIEAIRRAYYHDHKSVRAIAREQLKNLNWVNDLAQNRFNALAGWNKSIKDLW